MILASFFLLSIGAHFTPCSEPFLNVSQRKNFTYCKKLTTLEAEFAWRINNEQQIEILFGTRLHTGFGWLAWGVNPDEMPQMVGTRAMIGIWNSDGSTFITTYNITSDTKMGCMLKPEKMDEKVQNEVGFHNMSMENINELDYFAIQARVILPPAAYNISKLNHVWQIGDEAEGTEPKMHAKTLQNVDSTETINLWVRDEAHHVGKHENHLRTVHGILNIVGWGTLLPFGVIIARYFKYPLENFHDWRIPLHVSCQIIGYILGTSGWILGLVLGNLSKFYIFKIHRLYSIFIFTFTTLQMLALRLKPGEDDEYRKFWNMYHHFLGYALLAVISINIFHGINILKPNDTWRQAYIGILISLGAIVTVLEIYTWTKFKRSPKPTASAQAGISATGLEVPQPRP
ncbi:hypothetical protein GH714_023827 [Hevea brasiliensis]|uniref:Cytochrome b561 and DOMON domain-containing protein n=1 Tax=Hevea brasiliensis TaxID=3981 RepID=A0A6A6MPH6_HEVBR|nr:hypothetical protein GH714_023827 [Hevea brasiliensis]